MWSTGEVNGKPLQYSCLENPMNSMKRQNDRILKEELPRSVGAQYATGDQWRNDSRKNEGMEPKQKQYPVVDVPKLHEVFVPCACCLLAVTLLQAFHLGPRLEGCPCLNHIGPTDGNRGMVVPHRGSKSFSQQQPGSLPFTVN